MYVILPGEMGYEGSYRFVAAARRVIEEAGKLLKDADFVIAAERRVIEEAGKLLKDADFVNMEDADELTPEQERRYQHYVDTAEELLIFYARNGDEPITEEYGELFTIFIYALASDEIFHSMTEYYFRMVNDALNELIKSSSDQSLRVRGADRMLGEYSCISATMRRLAELGRSDNFVVIDTLADLFID